MHKFKYGYLNLCGKSITTNFRNAIFSWHTAQPIDQHFPLNQKLAIHNAGFSCDRYI